MGQERFWSLFQKTYTGVVAQNPDKYKNDLPQFRRLISFIDERNNNTSRMITFEPPSDSDKIPNTAPSELYLANSALCLIPKKNYTPCKMMAEEEEEDEKDAKAQKI